MSSVINCVAIDDEPLALEVISKFCRRIGGISLYCFTDPVEGLAYIEANRPDIVFLDIEMGELNGLQIASRLPEGSCFIFTTAYLHYALDGYDLDAVDYLHKPFAFARFQSAYSKALRRLGQKQVKSSGQYIVVKQDYANINIPIDDIIYVEGMERYSKIFRTSGECVVTRVLLKNIMSLLPPDEFIRTHRSFIVSRSKVKSFSRQETLMNNEVALPVGRQYAPEIMRILGGTVG